MKHIHTLFLGMSLGLLMGCVEEVGLPIRQTQRRLVVEGLVSDGPFPWVRLTYTGRYTSANPAPPELTVDDALVILQDDRGRSVRLLPDPFAPAYYSLPDSSFTGEIGRSYTLLITLADGRRYASRPERLQPVAELDSLTVQYRRGFTELGQPDFYDVRVNTQDPPTLENYYRWAALGYLRRWVSFDPLNPPPQTFGPLCNTCSCWVPYYNPFTDVLSDALINGNRIVGRLVFSAPIYAVGPQYIQVRQFSLTRAAYQYWTRYEQQRSRSGSLFDAQPASIEGNVRATDDTTQVALGFFGASAVSQQRVTVPGDTIHYGRFMARFGQQFIPPQGDCFSNFSQPLLVPPTGWPPR